MNPVKPVLLIWQALPENTKVYLFTDLSEQEFDSMCKAHGSYVNTVNETSEVLWLNSFLYDEERKCSRFEPIVTDESVTYKVVEDLPQGFVIVISGFLI